MTRMTQPTALIRLCSAASLAIVATAVQADTPPVQDLLKRLMERDAIIEDLMHRVNELERRGASPKVRSPGAANGHAAIARPIPRPSPPAAPNIAASQSQGPKSPAQAPAA